MSKYLIPLTLSPTLRESKDYHLVVLNAIKKINPVPPEYIEIYKSSPEHIQNSSDIVKLGLILYSELYIHIPQKFKEDVRFLSLVVKHNTELLFHYEDIIEPSIYKQLCIDAIRHEPTLIYSLPLWIKNDFNIVLSVVALEYDIPVDSTQYYNKNIILVYASQTRAEFSNIPKQFQIDPDVFYAFVYPDFNDTGISKKKAKLFPSELYNNIPLILKLGKYKVSNFGRSNIFRVARQFTLSVPISESTIQIILSLYFQKIMNMNMYW